MFFSNIFPRIQTCLYKKFYFPNKILQNFSLFWITHIVLAISPERIHILGKVVFFCVKFNFKSIGSLILNLRGFIMNIFPNQYFCSKMFRIRAIRTKQNTLNF